MEKILHDGKTFCQVDFELEADLESLVVKNSRKIFGENTIYFDLKKLLKEKKHAKKYTKKHVFKTIPDGYLLRLGDEPSLALVENELHAHDIFRHILPQFAKFNLVLKKQDKWDLVKILQEHLDENPAEMERADRLTGSGINRILADTIMNTDISYILIIDKKSENLDEALEQYSPEIYVIKKFENGKQTILLVDGPGRDDENSGELEEEYLERKNIRELWMYAKKRILQKIPGTEFHMTQVYGAFKTAKIPMCGITASKNKIHLYYATDLTANILAESEFIENLHGSGHHYGGSDLRSVICTKDDINRAIPFLKKLYERKKSKPSKSIISEEKYLEKYPKMRNLWRETKEKMEKFPGIEFVMGNIHGKFIDSTGRIFCVMSATKKKIEFGYGTKVDDGILSENDFIRDVSKIGKHFPQGHYRSIIRSSGDIDTVMQYVEKIHNP